jgi:hypothetical protein
MGKGGFTGGGTVLNGYLQWRSTDPADASGEFGKARGSISEVDLLAGASIRSRAESADRDSAPPAFGRPARIFTKEEVRKEQRRSKYGTKVPPVVRAPISPTSAPDEHQRLIEQVFGVPFTSTEKRSLR